MLTLIGFNFTYVMHCYCSSSTFLHSMQTRLKLFGWVYTIHKGAWLEVTSELLNYMYLMHYEAGEVRI
jgi:hypothetical protein